MSAMSMLDPDKAIKTIMLRRNKGGATSQTPISPSVTKEADGSFDPRHAAAEAIMQAVHNGKASELVDALGNFHDLHNSRGEAMKPDTDNDGEAASRPEESD